MIKVLAFGLVAILNTPALADEGRYQAFVGSEIRDKDEGTEDPGIWIVDTESGQLAFCQAGLINVEKTAEGYTIGEPKVSCTPWQRPEADVDP